MEQNVILKSNRKYFSSSKKHIIKTKLSLENYKKLNLVIEKAHQLFRIPAMLIFKSFVCEASTIFHYQQLHPQQLFWLLWNLQSTDKEKDNFKTRHFNYNLKILCSVFKGNKQTNKQNSVTLNQRPRGFLWEGEVFFTGIMIVSNLVCIINILKLVVIKWMLKKLNPIKFLWITRRENLYPRLVKDLCIKHVSS